MRSLFPLPAVWSGAGTSSTPKTKCLGKVASKTARLLMGKHKPMFTPYLDTGDHVIVINAAKIRLTRPQGRTETVSPLHRVSRRTGGNPGATGPRDEAGPPGGRRGLGMLPKTKLGKQMYRKLKVYAGAEASALAQQPVAREV